MTELPECEHRMYYDSDHETDGICRWYETCVHGHAFHIACRAVLARDTCPEGWR